MAITIISSQSTEYVSVAVTAPSDPTGSAVSFAFLGPYSAVPQALEATVTNSTVFIGGSWGASTTYPTTYPAQCLVGPSGSVTLSPGTYLVYVQIDISPETPVLWAGPLVVS
jgi:hypothetical protein